MARPGRPERNRVARSFRQLRRFRHVIKTDRVFGILRRTKLAAATRKDYLEAFEWLRDEFDILLTDITQPDLYDLRDKCANQKWPRFADQMISALSSMFRQAVKRGRSTGMKITPCLGARPDRHRDGYLLHSSRLRLRLRG